MISLFASRSRFLSIGSIAAFLFLAVSFPMAAQDGPKYEAHQGALKGTVYSEGMKYRVANAVVKIRNLNTQKEYTSQPTDPKGNYRILMVEEGWYTLGVTTAAGDFNLNYGIYIKAGETATLSVETLPGGMLEGKGGGGNNKSFFSKPEGILLLVVAAGGAGFAIYELTKTEGEASPIR